jgi:hypothetical protein
MPALDRPAGRDGLPPQRRRRQVAQESTPHAHSRVHDARRHRREQSSGCERGPRADDRHGVLLTFQGWHAFNAGSTAERNLRRLLAITGKGRSMPNSPLTWTLLTLPPAPVSENQPQTCVSGESDLAALATSPCPQCRPTGLGRTRAIELPTPRGLYVGVAKVGQRAGFALRLVRADTPPV